MHGGEFMKKNIKSDIQVDLSDRVAVVIGGTGSIGQEISISLFDSGANVIVASRSKNSISNRLNKIINKNHNISFLPVDLLSEESVKKLSIEVLDKYGKIDILILSSGVQNRKAFNHFILKEWNTIIGTNLTGAFLACKYIAQTMIDNNYGRIIGITSLTSEIGIRNISAYAASKGGMTQFLKTISIELSKYNITVNMIAPGRIQTKMTEDLIKNGILRGSSLNCIPMRRFGLPSDLIGAVLFLTSESANYITGQTIVIDGGWLASGGNPLS